MTTQRTLTLLAMLWGAGLSGTHAQTCNCGPTFCTNTSEFKQALATKKKLLSTDHPPRLIAIFDKVDRCEASITRSPDGFSLFRRSAEGAISIDTWTVENEKIGAAAKADGELTECRVIVARRAFECCGSKPFDSRDDYVKALDLNTSATVPCMK